MHREGRVEEALAGRMSSNFDRVEFETHRECIRRM